DGSAPARWRSAGGVRVARCLPGLGVGLRLALRRALARLAAAARRDLSVRRRAGRLLLGIALADVAPDAGVGGVGLALLAVHACPLPAGGRRDAVALVVLPAPARQEPPCRFDPLGHHRGAR